MPINWKREIEATEEDTGPAHYGNALPIMNVKNVYCRMLQPLIKQPTSQKKIEIILASLNIDWPQIYMIPQKVTIDSALRIFQYKILTNTFYLNKGISKFNTAISALCSLCSLKPEDVLHLFCHCPKTQNLWESFRGRLSPQFSLPEFTPTLSILGNWNNKNTHNILLNHIIILFKNFIYDNRIHLLRIHIIALINLLEIRTHVWVVRSSPSMYGLRYSSSNSSFKH